MNNASNGKYKRPKQKSIATTNPETSKPRNEISSNTKQSPEHQFPLLAKDSEWVDNTLLPPTEAAKSVEGEDGPQMKPLAIMFPDLIEKDPQTLQGVLNRAMSTTEVTRHLVDLGQKANFTFMKKADRLIPPNKQWMETLTENSNSYSSVNSAPVSSKNKSFMAINHH